MKSIVLASTSIYRKQQLERLNIDFSTSSPDVDEDAEKAKATDHEQLSRDLALLKAREVSQRNPEAIVIGGDQVASFQGEILSKPGTKHRAVAQLKKLAGEEHQLITSLAIIVNGKEHVHTCSAFMKMRALSDEQITRYVEIDEPLYSCGAYKLETVGISLFERIECEDYTSIIGIPLIWTVKKLSELGVAIP